MKRSPKMRTPVHTRLNLVQEKYYRPFIDGYIRLLHTNLKQVKHVGHNYSYTTFTCGESHDWRNPNWKPFRLLWDYCERTGYDFYAARDIIFERLGRKLVCECEMLRDDEKRRRMELEHIFGGILMNREKRGWSWFSLLFYLIYWSGMAVCIAFANNKQNFRISQYGLIAGIYHSAKVWVSYGKYTISQSHFDGSFFSHLRYENDITMINK